MNEALLFKQLNFWRNRTLAILDETTEEEADKMREGFSNNIRWNLGHILVIHDRLLLSLAGEPSSVPDSYVAYFNKGTSPADWEDAPPTLTELRGKLEAQPMKLEEVLTGRLEEKLVTPLKGMETVKEMIAFAPTHEAMHVGTILGLKKSL
ncbi:DinB family protein [Scopulibacillus darangshiensis]|uniref:DinB family protein n=1 Tax=Scopulibacillus darangshiensis TaxID=442528 RepID=A0A4R2P6U7_9BACL|nr:DinB family protein [Scopulibacillus darangshiensis]TCP30583.1 DinB family protein [Scopulibacillus darangshiensis]